MCELSGKTQPGLARERSDGGSNLREGSERSSNAAKGGGGEGGRCDLLASFLGTLANYDSICISSNKSHAPVEVRAHTRSPRRVFPVNSSSP